MGEIDAEPAATAELRLCDVCHAEQRVGDRYCRHCGARQIGGTQAEKIAEAIINQGAGEADGLVLIVDDNVDLRESLKNLIRSVGLRVEAFSSGQELLSGTRPDMPSCLVLDVRLPGSSGLDLQKQMVEAQMEIPIIFITGHADVPMTVQAMKAGAVDFLTKPFRDQDLLDAISLAIERDRKRRAEKTESATLRVRYELLTPREREVMGFVVAGLLDTQIAVELGTSELTIKIQRNQVMQKMQAQSLADLMRMAEQLGTPAGSLRNLN